VELLRPQDAFFLYTETPCVQQHVGGLAILDSSGRPQGPLCRDELVELLDGRLSGVPRLRQRVATAPLGLARAAWVDDDAFDLGWHVHRLVLPSPGGWWELCATVEELMAAPLDRSRPLWELHLIDGLDGGSQAVVLKLHHAIADGLGALNVAHHLFGPSAGGARNGVLRRLRLATSADAADRPAEWDPEPPPSTARLFWATLGAHAAAPWRAFGGAIMRTIRHPARSFRRAGEIVLGIWQLARAGTAPRCPLNRPVTARRRIVLTEVPLDQVKRVRGRLGGTINDIVLTLVAEGVHSLLEQRRTGGDRSRTATDGGRAAGDGDRGDGDRGTRADAPTLRVMVPVAVRPPGQAAAPGTWTSALSVDVPVGPMRACERLTAVRALTKRAKRSHQPLGATFLMQVVGAWAPAPLHARAARFVYRGRWFNLIVTTLGGIAAPVHIAGARVEVAYPLMPLASGVGITAAAMTWGDRVTIGLTADAGAVPDLELVADAVLQSMERLHQAASDPAAARARWAV
jgi:diacylglycerol O-acyltransferase / wax synthase